MALFPRFTFLLRRPGLGGMLAAGLVSGAPARAGDAEPLVATIDHCYATSVEAQKLFGLFRDTLGLPEVWPFKDHGTFASGAVSLGNVALEFSRARGGWGWKQPAEFAAMAFEPVGDTAALVAGLDRRGIAHGPPEGALYKDDAGRPAGWVNTGLTGLVPADVAFACDYVNRAEVAAGRQAAQAALARHGGGPLGVVRLKEIVVGVTDLTAARGAWARFAEAEPAEGAGFAFGPGPGVRLEPAARPGIKRIVLQVSSLDRAAAFLSEHRLLGWVKNGAGIIDPAAIDGLQVVLVEN